MSGLSDVTSGELTAENSIIISDLTIQDSKRTGLNVYDAPAIISNVKLKNNAAAGMVVQSKVVVHGIITEGNVWGGVNVDKRSSGHEPAFAFDENSSFNEDCKIWSEAKNGTGVVSVPDGSNWKNFTAGDMNYWTNKEIASTGEINVVYEVKIGEVFTDKATIKVKYGDKPALSYSAVPEGKPIQIIVEPMVGYTLSSAKVTVFGDETSEQLTNSNGIYKYNGSTENIKIKAEVTVAEDESTPEGVESEKIVTEDQISSVTNPTVVASKEDFNIPSSAGDEASVIIKSKAVTEDAEVNSYIDAINEDKGTSISASNTVIYDITPVIVSSSGDVVGKAEVSAGSEVTLAFPYPAGYDKSDLESVTVYHFADNGIEQLTTNKKDNYIEVTGVKSFSPFVLTYTVAEPPVVITYHDLHITESVGAKLVSRNGKDRTPDGGSFTLSLEKEEGYEDCEPTVYYKRGRFGDWNELKLDEVSGYYQIRSVYTDIYVKVSGDGIWPVSNEEVEAQEVKVYTQNGAIVVSTPSMMDVQIISMTGAQVAADKVAGQREFRNLAEGIYVVRVGDKIVKVRL